MNAETIYAKYWTALVEVEAVMIPADTAVALALNLAVSEAYDAGGALQRHGGHHRQPDQQTPDQRQAEADQAQMALIAEWLAENAPALYYSEHGGYGDTIMDAVRKRDARSTGSRAEIAKVDADNAGPPRTAEGGDDGWKRRPDADRLALRIAQQPARSTSTAMAAVALRHANWNATWAWDGRRNQRISA